MCCCLVGKYQYFVEPRYCTYVLEYTTSHSRMACALPHSLCASIPPERLFSLLCVFFTSVSILLHFAVDNANLK